jgi:hypothetical protein
MDKQLKDISKTLHRLFEQYKNENNLSESKYEKSIDRVTSTITTFIDTTKQNIIITKDQGLSVSLIQEEAKLELLLYLKEELRDWDNLLAQSFELIDKPN